jgi:hypothetical protein
MKRNPNRMQYQTDKLSSTLCILSIIANIVFFVGIYTNRSVDPDWVTGADVLINIVFMMIVFLSSEKMKLYTKKWNFYVMGLGAVQVLRVFWLPSHYKALEMLIGGRYLLAVISLLTSAALLFAAGLNSTYNIKLLSKLDDNTVVGG